MSYRELKDMAIQKLFTALKECETLGIILVDTRDGREETPLHLTYKENC